MESAIFVTKIIQNVIKRLNDKKNWGSYKMDLSENENDVEYIFGDIKVLNEIIKYDFFEIEI